MNPSILARKKRPFIIGVTVATTLCAGLAAAGEQTGNAIFIHPDGSGLNHWDAARMFWAGPDDSLEWDKLPAMAVYRGHMSDQLSGTSNGGATTHAFGIKVQGPDSYGRDRGREIKALSGYPGSYLREAAKRGHPVGIVNDGDIAGEPGTGAFLAETDNRGQPELHSLQLIAGRPGFNGPTNTGCSGLMDGVDLTTVEPGAVDCDVTDGERDPQVILGGGERFFLPPSVAQCTTEPTLENPQLDCYVHQGVGGDALPTRDDGRNLLKEAAADGYIVIRTRAQFDALLEKVRTACPSGPSCRYYAPKVLGLFASDDIFNDEEEEDLIAKGVVRSAGDPLPVEVSDLSEAEAERKIGRLVLWGAPKGDPANPFGFNPPTPAEMMQLALLILERKADKVGKPFALVAEVESTDNMPNKNNAVGSLRALKRADDLIGVARDFQGKRGAFSHEGDHQTLVLTAADSDGGALQVVKLRGGTVDSTFNPINCGPTPPVDAPIDNTTINLGDTDPDENKSFCEDRDPALTVTRMNVNPQFSTSSLDALNVQVDGIEGWNTPAFLAAPDALSAARSGGDPAFGNFDETGNSSFGGDTETYVELPFAVGWTSVEDTAGAILTRAEGLNAHLLQSPHPFIEGEPPLYQRFDNTDVYRMMYLTLFGERLPSGVGRIAADR